jgi:hypothetical protein
MLAVSWAPVMLSQSGSTVARTAAHCDDVRMFTAQLLQAAYTTLPSVMLFNSIWFNVTQLARTSSRAACPQQFRPANAILCFGTPEALCTNMQRTPRHTHPHNTRGKQCAHRPTPLLDICCSPALAVSRKSTPLMLRSTATTPVTHCQIYRPVLPNSNYASKAGTPGPAVMSMHQKTNTASVASTLLPQQQQSKKNCR